MRKLGIAAFARADSDLRILPLHRCIAHEFIGQAGRVPQQVLQRGRLSHGLQLDRPVNQIGHLLHRILRQVFGHWVIQQQLPLFHQHHGGHRHNRLGHGINAEYGIPRHGGIGGWVQRAQTVKQGQLAVPGNQNNGAGQALAIHLGLQYRHDATRALWAQADLIR